MLICASGGFGSGKSTLRPYLTDRLPGVLVVDMDELLEDGRLVGVLIADEAASADWPAYNRLWARILQFGLRSGHSVVFLTPCLPDEFPTPEPAQWLLLDCADEEREIRLRRRGWGPEQIADAVQDARNARSKVSTVIRTDDGDLAATADAVAAWIVRQVAADRRDVRQA